MSGVGVQQQNGVQQGRILEYFHTFHLDGYE